MYFVSGVAEQKNWQEFVRDDGLVIITTDVDLSRRHGEMKGLPASKSEPHVLLNYGQWVKLSLLSEEDEEKIIKYSDGRVDSPYEAKKSNMPRKVMKVVPWKTRCVTSDMKMMSGLKLVFSDDGAQDCVIVTRRGPSGCEVLPAHVKEKMSGDDMVVSLKELGQWKRLSALGKGEEELISWISTGRTSGGFSAPDGSRHVHVHDDVTPVRWRRRFELTSTGMKPNKIEYEAIDADGSFCVVMVWNPVSPEPEDDPVMLEHNYSVTWKSVMNNLDGLFLSVKDTEGAAPPPGREEM